MVFSAPDFTLRQLSYLVATADAGTIAQAAQELRVSPSALSDALTELERIVGTRLLVRRRAHGVSLTPIGAQAVTQARTILAAARELETSLTAPPGVLAGPITIGCYPTLAPTILPAFLEDFSRLHPQVELHIREATHDQLEGKLESGEIDVAFVYELLVPGVPNRESLFSLPAHVLLSAEDPLAGGPVNLKDLIDRDLILLDKPPSSEHTLSLFHEQGLSPKIRHRTSSYEAVRTLVGRGLGYGILVQRPRNSASYEGRPLVMCEITPPVTPVGVDVIWSATVPPSPRVRELIAFAHSIEWSGGERTQ